MTTNLISIFALVVFYSCPSNTVKDYWLLECDSTGIACRYVDTKGEVKIPYGKYYHCYTDTFRNFAIVSAPKGLMAINKKEEKLFDVYIFDNGPDYVVDGAFRIVNNNKMGFSDTHGNIIVLPIYDFVYPFNKGLAVVNLGGHSESVNPSDPNCEYHTWVEGKWGIINKTGELIKDIKYDHKWQDGKHTLIYESEIIELEDEDIFKLE